MIAYKPPRACGAGAIVTRHDRRQAGCRSGETAVRRRLTHRRYGNQASATQKRPTARQPCASRAIERHLATVDPESVACDVQFDFEFIDVDTIYARSGRHHDGYTAPEEATWQVLEETIEPYLKRMQWYHGAGRDEACDTYALGVLRGLYDFHHDSEAEWKELAPDDARETFGWALRAWQQRRKGAAERQAMRDQLATWCASWKRDGTLRHVYGRC